MFAIVEINGHQHKVKKGMVLKVEKLEGKEGATLTSDRVLAKFDDKKTELGTPYLKGAYVEYVLEGQGRGPKIRVFKKKAKKRYQKTIGHRQAFTSIKITAIK